ncbi:MAG: hypothetical protein ACRCZF_16505, partial [Gemmataceae bacterium]
QQQPIPIRRTRRWSLVALTAMILGTAALGVSDGPLAPGATTGAPLPTLAPMPAPDLRASIQLVTLPEASAKAEMPAVALEWSGPKGLIVQQKGEYTLNVSNVSTQAVQKVMVQVRLPKHVVVSETQPAAKIVEGIYAWDLGTIDVKTAKPIRLTLSPTQRGELAGQAWVTFTGNAGFTVNVHEPRLETTLAAPATVVRGESILVQTTVANSGDTRLSRVQPRLKAGADSFAGADYAEFDLRRGEKQFFSVPTTNPGKVDLLFSAQASDGTHSQSRATVQVLEPKLVVEIHGPKAGLVGRRAEYSVVVKNVGEVELPNIVAEVQLPVQCRLVESKSGQAEEPVRSTKLQMGTLKPGAESSVPLKTIAAQTGSATFAVEATSAYKTVAKAETRTMIDGISALRMEVVDAIDPIEKGAETRYDIRITNTGTKSDTNLKLVCELPAGLEYVGCSGPTAGKLANKSQVIFEPISDLAPKTEAVFTVRVKASGNGDVRFKAALQSASLRGTVSKEESTRIYGE